MHTQSFQMPFFYVRGNHDINMPLTRKASSERRGPKYYSFRYRDVLFTVQHILPTGEVQLRRMTAGAKIVEGTVIYCQSMCPVCHFPPEFLFSLILKRPSERG